MDKPTRRSQSAADGRAAWSDGYGPGDAPGGPRLTDRVRAILVRALPRGALILASLTFVNFAMGLLETKVLAHSFGAGTDTDAYIAAYALPAFILEVLVVGGLIASFVPLYIGLRDEDEAQAHEFARTILTLAMLAMVVAIGIMVVFAPECVYFVAPGFKGEQRELAINLFRILAATQIVFAASWVLGEVLIAEKMWLSYALAPITYSSGIIVGALVLGPEMGVYGAAVGALGGASVYMAIRLFGVLKAGFVPWPRLSLRTKGLRQYFVLMLPKMVSQPLESSLIVWYFTALASTLQPGSVTILSYARKFQTAPELIIGAQFAIACFPALSAAADLGDRRGFRRIFGTNLATIAVLSTGTALSLLAFGWLGVRILLSGGAYTEQDVITTTMLVAIFAVSIPLESLVELLARAIYATKNTILPTLASVASFIALFVTAQNLAPVAGLAAIPAAYGVGMAVKLGFLAVALAPRMEAIGRPVVQEAPAFGGAFDPGTALAGTTWGSLAAERRRIARRERGRAPRMALAVVASIALGSAGLFTAIQAMQGASFGFAPVATPWARVRPTAAIVTPSATPFVAPSWEGTFAPTAPTAPAGPTPTATPAGQFAMDLYREGDFIGEYTNKWCVPAATQTMMNIMDEGADVSQETQARLFDLGNSIAMSRQGTPEPEAWAQALQQLGYGHYKVGVANTREAAVKLVVKQIRVTNRPAGLLVWYGWHSWVISGFVATADPAATDQFVVKALYVEDVWYPRQSKIWNKDRDGYSRPPGSEVPADILHQDFKAWNQAVNYPDYEKRFVVIIPVV